MKIYRNGGAGSTEASHTMFVAPGALYPNSDFMRDGVPIQFAIEFKYGVAEVPDNLGSFLIDKRMAQATPLILPKGV